MMGCLCPVAYSIPGKGNSGSWTSVPACCSYRSVGWGSCRYFLSVYHYKSPKHFVLCRKSFIYWKFLQYRRV